MPVLKAYMQQISAELTPHRVKSYYSVSYVNSISLNCCRYYYPVIFVLSRNNSIYSNSKRSSAFGILT